MHTFFFSSPNVLFSDYLSYASHQTLTTVTPPNSNLPSINTSALPERDGSEWQRTQPSGKLSHSKRCNQLTYCLHISNGNSNRRRGAGLLAHGYTPVCSRIVLFALARRITGSTLTRNVNWTCLHEHLSFYSLATPLACVLWSTLTSGAVWSSPGVLL